ncbi:MAG: sulfatase/phosphatase domain-containing protein, partial [Verrucomicrobiota bacterium]|nr:sulfatase/phosphatase domain-containing protein [Verrucomicrobiota bacterium]
FIALGPGIEPGSVCDVPVSGVDFLPTFADLAGYSDKLPSNIDGGSLRSLFKNGNAGKVKRPKPFLVYHQAVNRSAASAIRLGDYKLVKTWKSDQLELFDLSKDISEENDISQRMPSKTQELHQKLNDYLTEVGAETRRTED